MEAGHTEMEYYAFAKLVADKRHFNTRTAQILKFYGFNVVDFLLSVSQPDYPEDFHYWSEKDQFLWLLNDCKCPITILRAYLKEQGNSDFTKEYVISQYLRKFPAKSFYRFGDRNQVDEKHLATYTNDAGLPIDVQAMEMSEILAITEQDIVDFVIAHPKGAHTYKHVTNANRLEKAYYELTGMRLTYDYASQLIRMLDQGDPPNYDDVPF